MRTLMRILKKYVPRMLYGLAIKIAATLFDLLLPWMLAHVLSAVVPLGEVRRIVLWGALMVVCAVCARNFNIHANCLASIVGGDYIAEVRGKLFARTMRLSGRQLDRIGLPSMVSRLTSDSYNVQNMVTKVQRLGIRAPLIIIAGVCITATMEPVLTLVLLSTLPAVTLITVLISRRGVRQYQAQQEAADRLLRVVRENVTGIRMIRALAKAADETARFEGANAEASGREIDAATTMADINPYVNLVLNLSMAAVVVLGAWRVGAGATDPATIIAVLYYFTMISNAAVSINRIFVVISRGVASAGRIEEVLLLEDDLPLLDLPAEESGYLIEFRDVSFSYFGAQAEKKHVEHISFGLRAGQSLGVIGPTGCGKSTLINLLLRFYDPDEGRVLFAGRDVRSVELAELRRHFGVVFQNDMLFSDTVAGNILFGRDLDPARAGEAAQDAQAASFLAGKEGGLAAQVAVRGANLSGGQKQRLLVARALAGQPDVLVLDDSSSALDYRTDAAMRQAIRAHYAGATSVIVAQRISAIRHCDLILVMEEGRIIGAGDHEALMAGCPVYREIWISQTGGELDG